jgi:hypothetical protein
MAAAVVERIILVLETSLRIPAMDIAGTAGQGSSRGGALH